DRPWVWEPPRAVQSGGRAQVLLGVEVRRLAQRADPDPVDRVAPVLAAGLGLHDRDAGADDQVLEQRVGAPEPRAVAPVGIVVPYDEAVLIELARRQVEGRALAAARQRQRVFDRMARLEHLGAMVVGRDGVRELRPPREEVRVDLAVHGSAIARNTARAYSILALYRQRPDG